MQIIFDTKLVSDLSEKYAVLELDTVMQPMMSSPLTLYAVIEHITLDDILQLTELKDHHKQMIQLYKSGEWHSIPQSIEPLMGKWNGELDTFYQSVIDFSAESAKLNKTWDGIRHTIPTDG
jgi:hypothetical protein